MFRGSDVLSSFVRFLWENNTHVLKANDPIMHSALMLASSSHREKLLLGNILY
jgi:hypothetical protein